MDIITVMAILFFSVLAGAVISVTITHFIERARYRRNQQLQPLIGVVLPKEDNKNA